MQRSTGTTIRTTAAGHGRCSSSCASCPTALPEQRRAAQPAGADASAARGAPGPPLPQPRRAAGRPDPGRHDRPDQVGRPVRPGPRRGVLHVRDAHGRRRDQAPLPRQGLGGPGPAPSPGAAAVADHGDRRALPAARPLADGARAGGAAGHLRGGGPGGAGVGQRLQHALARRPGHRRRVARRSPTRWAPRTTRWRASSTASRSSRCWRSCRRARRGSCCCASSAT